MAVTDPRFIVVEGPIGVGKTTLAKRLAESFRAELVLELAEENPFLPRFYRNPKEMALPTQLDFLFQRARQAQSIRQADLFRPIHVADFLFEKDRLFAELTLSADELELYYRVYELLAPQAAVPDLVIYLQAPVDVLIERIHKRGVGYEQQMSKDYLQRLVDGYIGFFYHYQDAPLLIVNSAEVDFAAEGPDYPLLLERLGQVTSGRHYFNPSSIPSR